jgi:uncharacterized protein (DUF1697 family)
METFITFLRGINMAGHNSVKMTDLTLLYKNLGFNDAMTYIQSGNVIFREYNDLTAPEITLMIENAILKRFSYMVPVMIRTVVEIRSFMALNPFLSEDNFDPSKMAVILLYKKATEQQIQKVAEIDYPPDKFKIEGKEIFLYCPNGFGRTKLYTNFFEKKMGVTGTARNWKTISMMLKLTEKR